MGEVTWSPREVVGHLVHGEETDGIPRARLILEHGEELAFERFDRFAQGKGSPTPPSANASIGLPGDEVGPWRAYLPVLAHTRHQSTGV